MPKSSSKNVCPILEVGKETIVPIRFIGPDPEQVRRHFDEAELRSTGESIRQEGQMEAVKVTRMPPERMEASRGIMYEVLDGERRYRAIRLMALPTILVVLRPDVERGAKRRRQQIIFNFNRAPHTYMETSNALAEQVEDGNTTAEVGVMIGKTQSYVSQYLALQRLIPELQVLLDPPTPEGERISFSLARSLATAPKENQLQIWNSTKDAIEANQKRGLALVKDLSRAAALASGRNIRGKRPYEQADKVKGFVRRLLSDMEHLCDLRDSELHNAFSRKPNSDIDAVVSGLDQGIATLTMLRKVFWGMREVRYADFKGNKKTGT